MPLFRAEIDDGQIQVPCTETTVKDAPTVDPDRHLDSDEEADLYKYYGITAHRPGKNGGDDDRL